MSRRSWGALEGHPSPAQKTDQPRSQLTSLSSPRSLRVRLALQPRSKFSYFVSVKNATTDAKPSSSIVVKATVENIEPKSVVPPALPPSLNSVAMPPAKSNDTIKPSKTYLTKKAKAKGECKVEEAKNTESSISDESTFAKQPLPSKQNPTANRETAPDLAPPIKKQRGLRSTSTAPIKQENLQINAKPNLAGPPDASNLKNPNNGPPSPKVPVALEVPVNEFVYDTLSVDSESKKTEDGSDWKPPSLAVKPAAKPAALKKSANMRKGKSSTEGRGKSTKAEAKAFKELKRQYERVPSLSPIALPEEEAEPLDGDFRQSNSSDTYTPPSDTPSPLEFTQYEGEEMPNEKRSMPALSSALEECIEVDNSDRGVVEV